MIETWPQDQGVKDGASLTCARQKHAALAQAAPRYRRRYGAVPGIRIALHTGEVAAGEMGDWKKEITLLGDVMNTAARIEAAAKRHAAATVLSGALVSALPEQARANLRPLADGALDGKAVQIALWQDPD